MKDYKFPVSIYSCSVIFSIVSDVLEKTNKLNKKYKYKIIDKIDDELVEGQSPSYNTKFYYIIINEKYLTYNTISHEIYHIVEDIASNRGVVENESKAWLCGFISEKIYNFLKKNQIELK